MGYNTVSIPARLENQCFPIQKKTKAKDMEGNIKDDQWKLQNKIVIRSPNKLVIITYVNQFNSTHERIINRVDFLNPAI